MSYIGSPVNPPQVTFAQTDLAVHEAWGRFTLEHPRAGALMHFFVSMMGHEGAVVVSHTTLHEMTGLSISTLKRAISALKEARYIEVLQIGGKGGANAYVINERVAWTKSRDKKHMAHFSASVLVSSSEQREGISHDAPPLRKFPVIRAGEIPLPSGKGEDPPAQPSFTGLEPQLPTVTEPDPLQELEKRGQKRLLED